MAQRIIDLTEVLPEAIEVKMPNGEVYELPGDIPVPDFLEIARTVDRLQEAPEDGTELLEDLYDRVLGLFRIRQPDLEELPVGPATLGALVIQLYAEAAEEDEGKAPAPRRPSRSAGTRSTSRPKTTTRKSASSK